ncbi:DsrE/DsrF/DrsH-like family protein [bacterium]|nr:DsrE/DsrF/DrsH-like family protein [bacterium]
MEATATLEALEARLSRLESELAAIRENVPEDKVSMVVFSGDLDKTLAAFIIATGAATMGMDVSMFFTFWGLSAIKQKRLFDDKSLSERMMALMTPSSSQELNPSKMAFMGAGAALLRQMMKEKDVASLEDLIGLAREMGVKFTACEMSMDVMGIKREELLPEAELGGVAAFMADALKSRTSLFI